MWLGLILILINIMLSATVIAEHELYQKDSLTLQLDISGEFELVAKKSSAKVKEVSAELLLYPKNDYRQTLVDFNSKGMATDNRLIFTWNDGIIEKKEFGYSALVKTKNSRKEVAQKIPFPLTDADLDYAELNEDSKSDDNAELNENIRLDEYLKPTESIDSNHPSIVAKASELAEGEDDLFKVAFKLANWVEENVRYDLNSLTAAASQKASWVLENKEGVCDEMTSLFIAMCRSLGIPARFVSGISYTTSELFAEPWQPHGWAEVYFPEVGWVSFDIAFGQYGYVDVTHIKLRDGFDPTDSGVKYEWVADGVSLNKGRLDLKVKVKEVGNDIPEEIQLEEEILSKEIGFGSHNLIKGILKNTKDYYAAARLQLSVPEEIEVKSQNKRTLLLKPKEVRETFWVIKVPPNLDENYIYTFPAVIYSEKNISVTDVFFVQSGKNFYSKEEIEKLTVKDEEKSYSRKIFFDCNYSKELRLGEERAVKCSVKNIGNTNLENIKFCLDKVCETISLPINQMESSEITVKGEEIGWNKLFVSAENELIEKKISLEYAVLDEPKLEVSAEYPAVADFGKPFQIKLQAKKNSFNEPKEIAIAISGAGFGSRWEIDRIENEKNLTLELDGKRISGKNIYTIKSSWKDKDGMSYSDEKKIIFRGKADSSAEKIRMFINRILNLFS